MLILVVAFSSCVRNKNGVQVQQNVMPTNTKVFEVAEVVQASSYSYLKVKENLNERWVAVSKREISVGDVYYYDEALEMNNFKSKDLDRTFEIIYFINQISKTPIQKQPSMGMGGGMPAHSGKVESKQKSSVTLKKADGEITLQQIFANPANYTNTDFEIRGVVVKVNKEIMGKNWIHIQDGTDSEGVYDLTITTSDVPNVDDIATFKGKLTLNKDFGSGYSYDVIMEDAALTKTESAATQL